jgi:hypothetical protein
MASASPACCDSDAADLYGYAAARGDDVLGRRERSSSGRPIFKERKTEYRRARNSERARATQELRARDFTL